MLLALLLLMLAVAWRDADGSALRNDADVTSSSSGGCAAAGLCCQGKNNTCRVRQHPNHHNVISAVDDDNSVLGLARHSTCFCDSSCVDLDDCCDDYKQTCARKFISMLAVENRCSACRFLYCHLISVC